MTLCQTADVHDSDTESERDAHEQFVSTPPR